MTITEARPDDAPDYVSVLGKSKSGLNATAGSFELQLTSIPEPSTWAMIALGFVGLGFVGRRASRKSISMWF